MLYFAAQLLPLKKQATGLRGRPPGRPSAASLAVGSFVELIGGGGRKLTTFHNIFLRKACFEFQKPHIHELLDRSSIAKSGLLVMEWRAGLPAVWG